MSWREVLLNDLKRHEGLCLKPYKDTVGVWTIGYGHTKNVTKDTPPITQEQAEKFLADDAEIAIKEAKRVVPCFDDLNGPRKTVVANMSFNMGGPTLAGFKNTIAAICAGNYGDAALRMLKSKWATQVGQRARFLANRMATGKW